MNFKLKLIILLCFFLYSCDQSFSDKSKKIKVNIDNRYKNIGFALVYNDSLESITKLESRSLDIYHKSLKKKNRS